MRKYAEFYADKRAVERHYDRWLEHCEASGATKSILVEHGRVECGGWEKNDND